MDSPSHFDLNARFQKIDKVALLAACPLFSGLTQWELKAISQLMRLVEYKKDEIVYRQGEEAGSFYVVVSGRFEAYLQSLDKKKILAYLRRGDYFGEISLLTNEPHSATLHALSDALCLVLKKEDFKKTIESNATVSLEISRRMSARLKGAENRSRSLLKSDIISIFSNQHQIGRTAFSINLAASLVQETHQKTVLLDMSPSGTDISSRLQLARKVPLSHLADLENRPPGVLSEFITRHTVGFDVLSVGSDDATQTLETLIVPLLNHLAIDYRFILIDLPGEVEEMVLKTMSQSDLVFFVTDSGINNVTEIKEVIADIEKTLSFSDERIAVVINEAFLGIRTTASTKKELFGKKICYSLPATVAIKEFEEASHMPFVVDEPEADYSRVVRHIARRISNNLVGVALGSGAALGLAHIGVLKILEKEGIPIDMVAGSSIGALIGSLYAIGKNSQEIEKIASEINSQWKLASLMDFNVFPVRGLLDGRNVMKHFRAHLGNKTFDDCRIPLKIIGANLSSRQADVLDSGLIADAVRASIAIPAIFNPVFLNRNLVVDGGILSPLPIRALHAAGANKVIAVNVFPTSKDILERRIMKEEAAEKESQIMAQKSVVTRAFFKCRKTLARCLFPNVFDILMNTIQAMESEIAEIEGDAADVLLRPVVPEANWVDFFKPKPFIKRGEEETIKHLPRIKALVSQQTS